MNRLLFLLLSLAIFTKAGAQNNTSSSSVSINVQPAKDSIVMDKVLIVPFTSKMYISGIDRDILEASNTSFDDMVSRYRFGLALALKQSFSKTYEPEILQVRNAKPNVDDDEKLTYRSIGYKYEALPQLPTSQSKLKSLFKSKKEAETRQESGIVNGQVVTVSDDAPKYMSTVIQSKKLLPYLSDKYGSAYFMFINEFELSNNMGDNSGMHAKNGTRLLRIHYTFMNKNEGRICSGIAENTFSDDMNNIDDIMKANFPAIAQKILNCVPLGEVKIVKTSVKNNN